MIFTDFPKLKTYIPNQIIPNAEEDDCEQTFAVGDLRQVADCQSHLSPPV